MTHGIIRRVFIAAIGELEEVMRGFKLFNNLENVIRAIVGTHIPILGHGENNDAYINGKGYPSIVL